MMNLKGSGRKWSWPNRGTSPTFTWNDSGRYQSSVRKAGVPAEIGTQNFPNTNLQRYRYVIPLVRFLFENLIVAQLVKKFSAFYVTRSFYTVTTRALVPIPS
jgi:hypothetical protein